MNSYGKDNKVETALTAISQLSEDVLFQEAVTNISDYLTAIGHTCDNTLFASITTELLTLLSITPDRLPINTQVISRVGDLNEAALEHSNRAQIHLIYYLAKKHQLDPNEAATIFCQRYAAIFDSIIHKPQVELTALPTTAEIPQIRSDVHQDSTHIWLN